MRADALPHKKRLPDPQGSPLKLALVDICSRISQSRAETTPRTLLDCQGHAVTLHPLFVITNALEGYVTTTPIKRS